MDFYSCDPLEKTPRQSTRDPSVCFFQPTSPIHSRPTCKSRRAHCQGYHGSLSMSPSRRASICRPHPLRYGTTTRLSPSLPKEAPVLCHCEVYFSPYPLPTWVSETMQWFSINFFSFLTSRKDWLAESCQRTGHLGNGRFLWLRPQLFNGWKGFPSLPSWSHLLPFLSLKHFFS